MSTTVDRLTEALASRYRIERELGRGGMATVYLAHDLKHDRPVAVKVLRPELAQTLGSDRFVREIAVTARLDHPHVLPLLDSGEAGGFVYYVMPYVEGESLAERLRREMQLPIADALQIAREVGDALSYAHAHGVIHRDIKPHNIMLSAGHARVTDFGIARAISAAGDDGLTAHGLAVGTPAYMSPEQAASERDIDGRSDVYALGCVLYEMLAGRPPFPADSARAILARHAIDPVPRLSALRPSIPPDLESVIDVALAKSPADRFSTAAELVDALTRLITSPAVSRLPSSAMQRRRTLALALLGIVVLLSLAVAVAPVVADRGRAVADRDQSRVAVAVLPLQNLSTDPSHAFLAGGLHDEILTQLSKVSALTVINRLSVARYAGTDTRARSIADELDVGTIVVGSVQVVGKRLRVNVQLIDARSEAQVWADRFDAEVDDAFAVQTDVAQRIVAAVGVRLRPAEQARITATPTENADAYHLYLQALNYLLRPGWLKQNLQIAEQLLERAVAHDSSFALARADLSLLHGSMYHLRHDPSPRRLVRQREEAEAALRLAPGLPQAHQAMGSVHYIGQRDYHAALRELRIARSGLPNDADILVAIGLVQRRLGNWDGALDALAQATRLDPRDPRLLLDLAGLTYFVMHRYSDAAAAFDKAHEMSPDLSSAVVLKGRAYAAWHGTLDTLRAALTRVPPEASLGAFGTATSQRANLLLWERRADRLLETVAASPERVFDGIHLYLPTSMYAGWAHRLKGDARAARVSFESALALLDSVARELPSDWRVHAARGLTLAALGRYDEAAREAEWIREAPVYHRDALTGPAAAEERARILAQIGSVNEAVDELQRLLKGPSWISRHLLQLDPLWDPIRPDARFQALVRGD